MFQQMQQQGLTPDVVTYTAVISAYEKGGQWRLALSAYEQMRERGCRPDAIVFNAIIDALWGDRRHLGAAQGTCPTNLDLIQYRHPLCLHIVQILP